MKLSFRVWRYGFYFLGLVGWVGCAVFAARPVNEMSQTNAAIRAAREVQAETLAPEYFRQANEWFFKAKHEYKFKNFRLAKEYADKARSLAEQAEYESMRGGGNRENDIPDPMANEVGGGAASPSAEPYAYPTPQGSTVESLEVGKGKPPPPTNQ